MVLDSRLCRAVLSVWFESRLHRALLTVVFDSRLQRTLMMVLFDCRLRRVLMMALFDSKLHGVLMMALFDSILHGALMMAVFDFRLHRALMIAFFDFRLHRALMVLFDFTLHIMLMMVLFEFRLHIMLMMVFDFRPTFHTMWSQAAKPRRSGRWRRRSEQKSDTDSGSWGWTLISSFAIRYNRRTPWSSAMTSPGSKQLSPEPGQFLTILSVESKQLSSVGLLNNSLHTRSFNCHGVVFLTTTASSFHHGATGMWAVVAVRSECDLW